MSEQETTKLDINWRRPEAFGEYDVGLVAHVKSWTVSGQIIMTEASEYHQDLHDVDNQCTIHVIDFDETSPVVVNTQVIYTDSKFEAMGIANKAIAAYVESISGLNIVID